MTPHRYPCDVSPPVLRSARQGWSAAGNGDRGSHTRQEGQGQRPPPGWMWAGAALCWGPAVRVPEEPCTEGVRLCCPQAPRGSFHGCRRLGGRPTFYASPYRGSGRAHNGEFSVFEPLTRFQRNKVILISEGCFDLLNGSTLRPVKGAGKVVRASHSPCLCGAWGWGE